MPSLQLKCARVLSENTWDFDVLSSDYPVDLLNEMIAIWSWRWMWICHFFHMRLEDAKLKEYRSYDLPSFENCGDDEDMAVALHKHILVHGVPYCFPYSKLQRLIDLQIELKTRRLNASIDAFNCNPNRCHQHTLLQSKNGGVSMSFNMDQERELLSIPGTVHIFCCLISKADTKVHVQLGDKSSKAVNIPRSHTYYPLTVPPKVTRRHIRSKCIRRFIKK